MANCTPNISKSLSNKYLTPCRSFGLKRKTPISGHRSKCVPLKRQNHTIANEQLAGNDTPVSNISLGNKVNTGVATITSPLSHNPSVGGTKEIHTSFSKRLNEECSHAQENSSIHSLCKNIDDENAPVKFCEDFHYKMSEKENLSKNENVSQEPHSTIEKMQRKVSGQGRSTPDSKDFLAIINRINEKVDKLRRIKQTKIYAKLHNLNDVQTSTEKWMAASKEVLQLLLDEFKNQGKNLTIMDILNGHSIPFDFIGFNPETLDFEKY